MRISYFFAACFLISNAISFNADAQANQQAYKKWLVGINGGAFVYQGDLTSDKTGSFQTIKPGLTISATKPLGMIALKGAFTLASLKGDDDAYKASQAYRGFRQFKFNAQLAELAAQANIYFHNERKKSWRFNPYLLIGVGGEYFFNTKINTSQTQFPFFNNADLLNRFHQDSVQGTPSFLFTVPFGAGFNVRITDRIIFNLEGVQRLLNTDYLDGFSISANPDERDQFFSVTAGVHFVLGKKGKGSQTKKQELEGMISGNSAAKAATQQVLHDTVYVQVVPKVKTDTLYKMMNDRDKDGIADSIDACADIAGPIAYKGCPEMPGNQSGSAAIQGRNGALPVETGTNSTGAAVNSVAKRDIYFDYDRVSLNGQAYATLNEIMSLLKQDNTLKVILKGHTDLTGTVEYNNFLSWQRATICSDFLQSYQISKSRITIEALGMQQPVASQGENPNLQWKNRRVEVIVYREK